MIHLKLQCNMTLPECSQAQTTSYKMINSKQYVERIKSIINSRLRSFKRSQIKKGGRKYVCPRLTWRALIFRELLPGVDRCWHCSRAGLRPFLPLHSTGLLSDGVQRPGWLRSIQRLCLYTQQPVQTHICANTCSHWNAVWFPAAVAS